MSYYDLIRNGENHEVLGRESGIIVAEVIPQFPRHAPPVRRRVRLPVILFVATCLSTLLAGCFYFGIDKGWMYACSVMTILLCHEAGHFLQARRCGVHASLPYFIPMPFGPIGTLGAVIAMQAGAGNRKAIFDIGITGPLAGLVPTIIFCIVGLQMTQLIPLDQASGDFGFGVPILLQLLSGWLLDSPPLGYCHAWHPIAFAGWFGLLITALNLLPIGQLDGGHVLYGLLRTNAQKVATLLLFGAVVAVFWYKLYQWSLMLFLLILIGPIHPPTANDDMPLGLGRTILGWLTLAFVLIGFTPTPFVISP